MFSQGHTATLHLPNGGIVNLVSNVLRKHDSNRPYALPRFWKSHIDIEIIQSKFVWICYIDIHQYKAENLRRKRPNNWICTFESSRKSICFRNQLSGLDFKKTWKFTCISSRRKDSGNVTGKIWKILVTHNRDEKWKCFGIASELEIFGTNWLIILLWMQRLQKKDK